MTIRDIAACLTILCASAVPVTAETAPARASDFAGKWRITRWIGESQGGFSGPDPNTLIGQTVEIRSNAVVTPDGTCRLQKPTLSAIRNGEIETAFWGGQRIGQLRLSRRDIARAFGHDRTRVLHDRAVCLSAVMIDHDHIVDALGSGVLYLLDRVK